MKIHIELTIPGFPWSIEDLSVEQHDAHVRAYERHNQLGELHNYTTESVNQTTLKDYYESIKDLPARTPVTLRKYAPRTEPTARHVKHAKCCGAPRRCQKTDGFCFDCRPDWAKTSDEDFRRRKSDSMNENYHGKN